MKARLYIDGFNFYYGIKNSEKLPIYLGWCDFRKLCQEHMLPPGEELGMIKYFTAPVGLFGKRGEKERQYTWLRAVETIPGLKPIFGFYSRDDIRSRVEKLTDVNIAVHMLADAILDNTCDRLVLISADVDLAPAVHEITTSIPNPKKVDVWFPDGKVGWRWKKQNLPPKNVRLRPISTSMLESSRLPEEIPNNGNPVLCIPEWRKPR